MEPELQPGPPKTVPKLVASTDETYCCSVAESRVRETSLQSLPEHGDPREPLVTWDEDVDSEANYFKSAQWSSDGTTLLASSADNTIRAFILPPNLLEEFSPMTITPYAIHTLPTSINCISPYPHFTLSEPTTTLYLSSPSSLPVRLSNCFSTIPYPLATYPLVSPTTEAYLTPSSILWSSPGTHFLAGTDCLIALFDVSRNGEGPVTRMPTIPSKRHKMKGGGVGMRGIVSALCIQSSSANDSNDGMLAAGTWTRWVGLYDTAGVGGTVATWSVADAADVHAEIGGSGVSQTLWSPCGRYLYVVERKSRGVLVFDIRVTGKLVAWLEGREADTNQRLGVDVFEGAEGIEIWAGGTDGIVRVWDRVGKTEGASERTWEWRAHNDSVTSAIVHTSGTVVATCSGQRSEPALAHDSDSESGSENENERDERGKNTDSEERNRRSSSKSRRRIPDNSIKVWSL